MFTGVIHLYGQCHRYHRRASPGSNGDDWCFRICCRGKGCHCRGDYNQSLYWWSPDVSHHHHQHHHLFLKHSFLPRSVRVRRLPWYEASPHIPEHYPFRVQTKLVPLLLHILSMSSYPCPHIPRVGPWIRGSPVRYLSPPTFWLIALDKLLTLWCPCSPSSKIGTS